MMKQTNDYTHCCLPLDWPEARLFLVPPFPRSQKSANLDIMNLSKGTPTQLCETILLATLREAIKCNRSAQPCIGHFDSLVALFHCRTELSAATIRHHVHAKQPCIRLKFFKSKSHVTRSTNAFTQSSAHTWLLPEKMWRSSNFAQLEFSCMQWP